MAYWLLKTEPESFSWDDQVKRGGKGEPWTGVRNYRAREHLKAMQLGDHGFFYHTGKEKSVVGIARAVAAAYPDPGDTSGKLYAVDVAPVRKLAQPVTLAQVKADASFASFALTRVPRLSVMPVTDDEWARIEAMSNR